MYELIQVSEKTYYVNCPAKIGIYRENDKDVYLIDSGNDKEAGKKIIKILDEQGWNAKALINTHSNADHVGGNRVLQERLSVNTYAYGIERSFSKFPVLEPSFLYGGYPFKDLRNKFLMAQSSELKNLDGLRMPEGMEILSLPGHFFHMIGVKTPDDVYFVADSVFSPEILDKYHVSFVYDVDGFLETLDMLDGLQGKLVIPSHSQATRDISSVVEVNRKKVHQIIGMILDICAEPCTFEEVLKAIFDRLQLKMDANQYVLVGSTIRSYLSYLQDQGRLAYHIKNNRMVWGRP